MDDQAKQLILKSTIEAIRAAESGTAAAALQPTALAERAAAIVGRGGPTSGNFKHKSVKGKHGGSAPGGGHGAIGIKTGVMTKDGVKRRVTQYRQERKRAGKFFLMQDDNRTAFRFGDKHWNGPFNEKLSQDERDALIGYQSESTSEKASRGRGTYWQVNNQLRGKGSIGKSEAEITRSVKDIDAALAKSRLPRDMVLHRGMKRSTIDRLMEFRDPDQWIGAEITDAGYMSTSMIKSSAQQHMAGARMEIKAPRGMPAAHVGSVDGSIPAFKFEHELVLSRGTTIKIISVQKIPNSAGELTDELLIEAEVVTDG